mgnify:FL=1
MTHSNLFQADSILLNMESNDADGILQSLANGLVSMDSSLASRRDEIYQALSAREQRGSTGTDGVGIPHVKLPGIDKAYAILGVHQGGIDFAALDGEPVHVFFSVLRPEDGPEEHIDLLRWIAGIAQHEDFVSFALQAQDGKSILELLSELATA